jgi:hypothetical protein
VFDHYDDKVPAPAPAVVPHPPEPASALKPAESEIEEGEPDDYPGAYSHLASLRMNARFVERLERAFARGRERRESAGAIYSPTISKGRDHVQLERR